MWGRGRLRKGKRRLVGQEEGSILSLTSGLTETEVSAGQKQGLVSPLQRFFFLPPQINYSLLPPTERHTDTERHAH